MSRGDTDASRRARKPETVTVQLERKSLLAARAAAASQGISLSEWLSRVAWEQAVIESSALSAEQYRLHPDEPPGWREEGLDRIFGQDVA
ncbi:hypothetical protein [Actinoplanes sp. G11-F43]|uniref:hypothetical protein n=1 Tax=Actinoplanes sp. G11-F43 TaxID=3424130 RepID=UPI003D351207